MSPHTPPAPETPESIPGYLTSHTDAISEIGYLAMLFADACAGAPLREVALRLAAERPSVQRAMARMAQRDTDCGCGCQ